MKTKKHVFLLMVMSVVSVTLALVPDVYGSDAYEQALLKAIEREYQEIDRQNDRMDQANRDYHNSVRQIEEDRLARERLSTIEQCFFLVFLFCLVCIAMYVKTWKHSHSQGSEEVVTER